MADKEETVIGVKTELTADDKASKKVKELKKNLDEATKSAEKLVETTGKISTSKKSSKKSSAAQKKTEQAEEEIAKATEAEAKSRNKIKSKAESIANMSEEQLKVYQYMLQTERKEALTKAKNAKLAEARLKKSEEELKIKAQNADSRTSRAKAVQDVAQARIKAIEERMSYSNRRRTPKYQAGRGLISAGQYVGKMLPSPVGNIASTGLQLAGTSLANPAAGVAVGITQLTKAIVELGSASVKAFSEIESLRTQLGVVYGNDTQAGDAFSQLSSYAIKSPFGVSQITELATLLKQSGVEATNLMDTLKMLGDTAGGNMEKMKRIANNYAQIVSIGKASMLDMRQFAYAGIPVFEKVAEQLNVSQTALRKMISDGKVTAEVIENVFKEMTSQGGLFFEATNKGAETLKARLTNLGDVKQLALAGLGEGFLNLGTKTGKDSVAYRTVDFAEKMYQKLQDWTTINNLEKDVKTIKNNTARQQEIKDLIEYAKASGADKDTIALFEKELKDLQGIFSPDKQRSYYARLYESYGGTKDPVNKNITNQIEEVTKQIKNLTTNLNVDLPDLNQALNDFYAGNITEDKFEEIKAQYTQLLSDAIAENHKREILLDKDLDVKKEQYNLLLLQEKITDDIRRGWNEAKILDIQQKAIDDASIGRKRSDSLENTFSEIRAAVEQSDEYKQKQEAEKLERWDKAVEILKGIKDSVDGNGVINMSKIPVSKLLELSKQGGLDGRKLAVNTDDMALAEQDRGLLSKQFRYMSNQIYQDFIGAGLNSGDLPFLKVLDDLDETTTEAFYKSYTDVFTITKKYLEDKVKNASNTKVRDFYKEELEKLGLSTSEWTSVGNGITPSMIDDAKKAATMEFIPLWKRIISSYTGIASTAITGTQSALDFYSNNLSTRNITGSTLSTAVGKGLSIDRLQQLTGYRAFQLQNKGDSDKVWQIDWEKTREEMTKFANTLSASTDVIDTWTSGLEAERKVYIDLIGSGILNPETNDVKSARYISTKKFDRSLLSEIEMGVNAFGEKLVNENGEEVLRIDEEGNAIGKDGNILANQNLKITGNIYDIIKDKLTKIDEELKQSRITQAQNKVLNALTTGSFSNILYGRGMSSGGKDLTTFYSQFGDQAMKIFEANLDKGLYENLEDLYAGYIQGNSDAVEAVNKSLQATNTIIKNLIGTEQYQKLMRAFEGNSFQEGVNKDWEYFNRNRNPMFGYRADSTNRLEQSGLYGEEMRWLGGNVLSRAGYTTAGIKDLVAASDSETEATIRKKIAQDEYNDSLKECAEALQEIAKNTLRDGFLSPFETLGEDIIDISKGTKDWSEYLDDAASGMRTIAGEMVANIGKELVTCGLRIASAAALERNWGMVAAGLGIAATGGFASGLGNAIKNQEKDKDKTDKETQKLESLKDEMVKLLEQARSDSLYYEKNLQHKTAIGTNEKFNYTSVNDAIITPKGVVSTAPDDYILAMKHPEKMASGTAVVQPIIKPIVNNYSSAVVKQEQRVNDDGAIEVITFIEDAVSNFIASPRSDDAFSERQYRLQGRQAIM